jgi:hypothetical protein
MKKTILFACTTLDEHSTLSRNFEYINKFIKKNYKNNVINSYFACYLPSNIIEQEYSSYLEDTLIENNYIINKKDDKSYVYNNMIIKFIKNNNNLSFDMIVMTGCDNLLRTITGKQSRFIDAFNEDIFDVVIKNMLILHNSLNENGLVYNLRFNFNRSLKTFNNKKYKQTTKRNFDYDYTLQNSLEFIIFIAFINRVRKLLFKNISRGKYIKRDINIEEYYIKCEIIKEKIKKKFKKKINSKKNSKDILEYLLDKYIKQYFGNINDISNEEIERVFNLYKNYLNK